MALEKKDFVEIEFTARSKDGEVFDSNIKEELEKLHEGHDHPIEAEPFVLCLGEGMFMPAVEEFLIGKPETPATYTIELPPEEAFGKRDAKLIQRIPLKVFHEQNINPVPGFVFNFDGRIGKVLASSGGRVIVDFNNPIAGKSVVYTVKILKKVQDLREKSKALVKFLFRTDLNFEIKDKKIILEIPQEQSQLIVFAKAFGDKFKDLLDLELEVKEGGKKAEKQEAPKNSETPEKSEDSQEHSPKQ